MVRDLWDSWEDDALLRDARSGAFLDPTRSIASTTSGLTSRWPVRSTSRGRPRATRRSCRPGPPSERDELGARLADVVFTAQTTIEDARAFRTDLRGRAAACGGPATEPAVLPGLVPIVADTVSGAQELYDRLGAFVDAEAALISLQASVGATAQTLAELGPAAAVDRLPSAAASHVAAAEAAIGRPVQTLGDLARFQLASGRGHRLIVGDGARVADSMQEWLEAGAADGFDICPPTSPAASSASRSWSYPSFSGAESFAASTRDPRSATSSDFHGRPAALPSSAAERLRRRPPQARGGARCQADN